MSELSKSTHGKSQKNWEGKKTEFDPQAPIGTTEEERDPCTRRYLIHPSPKPRV
jgi:hypothetical protein